MSNYDVVSVTLMTLRVSFRCERCYHSIDELFSRPLKSTVYEAYEKIVKFIHVSIQSILQFK